MTKRTTVKKAAAVDDPVTKYARSVGAKKVVAGPHVRNACSRHLRDLKTGRHRGLVWRPEEARRVIEFFAQCLMLDNEHAFILRPWQEFIVGSLFGWYMSDGTRRFRRAYIETGKGNGKSPLAAAIGLVGLCIDNEPDAEVYSAAVSREQARIVFDDAKNMVERSPALAGLVSIQANDLYVPLPANGVMRPVSSEHRGLDGKRVHMAIIDELHEHASAVVLDKMGAGAKARRNPLIVMITNAGYDRMSVCWREHEFAVKVASGAVANDDHFSYVCALDQGDDYKDERVWPKANPNYGYSIHARYLRAQVAAAQEHGTKTNLVKRLNFCEWTESQTVWIPAETWKQNAGARTAPQIALAGKGRPLWLGLELGAQRDFVAAVGVIPNEKDAESYDVLCKLFIPDEMFRTRAKLNIQAGEAAGLPFDAWRDAGWIEVTKGSVSDFDRVEKVALAFAEDFDLQEVVVSRYAPSQVVTHLQDELGEERVVEFGNTYLAMNAPVSEIARLAILRKLRHAGNPVLEWMVSNVAIDTDAEENVRIDKSKSAENVTAVVALAMAMGRAMVRNQPEPDEEEDNTYDEREVRYL